jgi:hypothetical protein
MATVAILHTLPTIPIISQVCPPKIADVVDRVDLDNKRALRLLTLRRWSPFHSTHADSSLQLCYSSTTINYRPCTSAEEMKKGD